MKYPYPEHAEELIKAYVSDAEELALKYSFGELYDLACERDEEAAAQLEMDCADLRSGRFVFNPAEKTLNFISTVDLDGLEAVPA